MRITDGWAIVQEVPGLLLGGCCRVVGTVNASIDVVVDTRSYDSASGLICLWLRLKFPLGGKTYD